MMNHIARLLILGAALLTGCATSENVKLDTTNHCADDEMVEESLPNIELPQSLEHSIAEQQTIQIHRYSVIQAVPTKAQEDILQVMIKVTLPEEIDTIGQAIQYLLKRSGYQLAPPNAQGIDVVQLFGKKLPAIHRKLGPMPLEKALLTLTAPAFRLQKDAVRRLIAYELTPDYAIASDL